MAIRYDKNGGTHYEAHFEHKNCNTVVERTTIIPDAARAIGIEIMLENTFFPIFSGISKPYKSPDFN